MSTALHPLRESPTTSPKYFWGYSCEVLGWMKMNASNNQQKGKIKVKYVLETKMR